MSELQLIESALVRAAQRRRWARALRGLWQGLLVGAVIWLVALAAYKLFPIPVRILPAAGVGAFVCMVIGFASGGWKKLSVNETARWVDGREHLQERLSTALEFAAKPETNSWRELVVTDAANRAKELNPRRLVQFSLPTTARWALLLLILGVSLGFVPEYRSKKFQQKQADQQVIKDVGRQIAQLTRREMERRPPALETTQKSMESVTQVGDQFTKKALTRSEALKDLANVTEKLKDEIKELSKDPALKKLQQAARSGDGTDSQTAAGLQKQIESLQKSLGNTSGNPDKIDKLKKELQKLQEAAKAMADKNSPGSEADRQKMSESLSALSKQVQELGLQLPQLDEAIAALEANQTDLFLKDLQQATVDLEKMRDMAKSLQQLQQQQQAEKLGKDLAEQLKKGQPEAAAQTLQKMAEQLKQGNISQEQMQKMMDEVAKAVDPAGNYGSVADKLKQAAKQLQQGQKPAAGQSLADAAKELENLAQQAGDAQSLQATLDALNKASMCIGMGQGWGQCKGPPKAGEGGKPGAGVGTWAEDDSGFLDPAQFTDRWDNSGVIRPDTDPKGHADRGPGELSDALTPTKVKGQFSPGGQMPSITLKGVSIKGQSQVSYEESVTAAQSDAQSALSQEKVPRAYQGTVRDYFDDLKK